MDKQLHRKPASSTSSRFGNHSFASERVVPVTLSPIQRLVVVLARQAANEMRRSSAFTGSATDPHSCNFSSSLARAQTHDDITASTNQKGKT